VSDRKIVSVAAAVIYDDGRVLACQRGAGHGYEGGWEFPGGKLEPGESAVAACRREIAEELGVRLSTMSFLDRVEYDYPDFHLSMDCYVCQLVPGQELRPAEHAELRWLSLDELTSVAWLPPDAELVQTLGHYWGQVFAFDDRF
jgi:8-oxo-dGTP diphosphatase